MSNDWSIDLAGHEVVTDAQLLLIRFADDGLAWGDIDAGTMLGGQFVDYDSKTVVATTLRDPDVMELTFSQDEVSIQCETIPAYSWEYLIGPCIPDQQRIKSPCPNPSTGNQPEGPSNGDGEVEWFDGLSSGGSYSVAGGPAVSVWVDFNTKTGCLLKTFSWIVSPDDDGDGAVDASDVAVFSSAYLQKTPIHEYDMDCDLQKSPNDGVWFYEHEQAQ